MGTRIPRSVSGADNATAATCCKKRSTINKMVKQEAQGQGTASQFLKFFLTFYYLAQIKNGSLRNTGRFAFPSICKLA